MAVSNRRRVEKAANRGVPGLVHASSWSLGQLVLTLVTTVWFLVTLPIRLLFWGVAWLGRVTALILGFSFMVVGMALLAGPFFFIGIPLFVVGLLLTLRCLD
jgi:hypothetical protein